ncbi:S-adenosyl-L-methionine-dependent methyltransferase [Radiomyces spectabilis]|uniref:S-adenosyl-L-methionine-dependent methyltransferase n=1 Tax=Radiomyces spectabilis TaxID=64574 RepID=UPI00221ECCFE|nr:S-adenosyl-L-methionine-dependent methyltransferase [Radiomyces spectabilis]KAI8388385.1 S-adenosyl-L-methionine-dependent methyltransferase [Radiomyces spectabilis]
MAHRLAPTATPAWASSSQYTPSEVDPQDETWDDWDYDDAESQCLFCTKTFALPEEAFSHCAETHGFDFLGVKRSLGLEFYDCIRMINYIRKEVQMRPELASVTDYTLHNKQAFADKDELLQPVLESDSLLHAFEELEIADEEFESNVAARVPTPEQQQQQPHQVDVSHVEPTTMLEQQLLQLLKATKDEVQNLEGQFTEYKAMVKKTFYDNVADDVRSEVSVNPTTPADEGNYYFHGYAQNDIHEQMLKDKARTEAYRDFMYDNKDVFKDKIVLDVGCGTGILSMFAAKAGAKQVFSVDNSAIIEKAKLNVKENGLDHIITLIRGKVEEIQLPVPQVDIIISEWMGYFLLFEAMLDSVLVARDRWLAPNGIMGPSHTRILMAALDDESLKDDRVNFWDDVYGFKMSAMKEPVLNECIVDFIKSSSVASTVVTLKDLYLQTITIKQLDFVSRFEIEVTRDTTIYALGGWFDTWFTRDGHPIPLDQEAQTKDGETFLGTGPFSEDTHWKQTIFILQEPIPMKRGDKLSGVFTCHKGLENPRELECEIEYTVDGSVTRVQNFFLHS